MHTIIRLNLQGNKISTTMRHRLLIFSILFFTHIFSFAQAKYEFRAVWVATVVNIDWPSTPNLQVSEQKQEVIELLDLYKSLGMNTVILQVRPAADAFYASELEPWSRYLSGTQGKAPAPFYDPLHFWVEQCHARGIELHAWLNPYRVTQKLDEPLSVNHVAFEHPEWIVKYGDRLYFDPGQPGARKFVVKVVKDIVTRYDVDAIHFDDYFYPYPLPEPFPDTMSFRLYGRGFLEENIADWRRENVDITIQELNQTIKATKPWVKFGISPFGVWRNKDMDPLGSDTKAGATNYDHLYANIIKWQEQGWIDYCLPQLYWRIGHPLVDFVHLANWWSVHTYGRAMYVGHGLYRMNKNSEIEAWTSADQLTDQIKVLRSIPEIQGSAYFSSKHFKRDLMGFQDSLINNYYQKPAIVPPMRWIDHTPPHALKKLKKRGRKIKWETLETTDPMNKAWKYVIYLNEENQKFNPENGELIFEITTGNSYKFNRINRKRKRYQVRVSVLDRLNNESRPSLPLTLKL
jgi:uncharacterized lipoprotein YddW (UPF0748 family)